MSDLAINNPIDHDSDSQTVAAALCVVTDAELLERMANLEADARSYRELAHAAIHALHALTVDHSRLRASHHRLLDAHRAHNAEAA